MKHFILIVNGYKKHNIAFIGADKEALFFAVHTHLKCLPQCKT